MLLFSTILDLNNNFSKEDFIDLVIEWNNTSKYEDNIIPDIEWNGEMDAHFGNEKLWLEIKEDVEKNIVAVRYEKVSSENIVWDTDYVVNFEEMRMAIRLDRSYMDDSHITDMSFSTPHFISLLIENGYIKNDINLPISRTPIGIGEHNSKAVLKKIILSNNNMYKLPVVYVSKLPSGKYPLDINWLASRIKGVAHVLAQKDLASGEIISKDCKDKNPKNGEVVVYYPGDISSSSKYVYRGIEGNDENLLNRIAEEIIKYSIVHRIDLSYTWQGVVNAILEDKLEKQRKDRLESEKMLKASESEAYQILEAFDEDMKKVQQQNIDLLNRVEALEAEVGGLRNRMNSSDKTELLHTGEECEFYQDEIKGIVIECLKDISSNLDENSRRKHIIEDIISSNNCRNVIDERRNEIKKILKGYKVLSGKMKQDLMNLGFTITDDGKHYKLYYYDDKRYQFTLAKTPSDNRSGNNIIAVICRAIL